MTDQSVLSSRAIRSMYYERLEANPGMAWVEGVSNLFTSDQASEVYPFLGQVPRMREVVGGRQIQGYTANSITIFNKHYEASHEFRIQDIRRDKSDQIRTRMSELADGAMTHWASLLTVLLAAAATTVCYDGQYFFDTDHLEGESGSQSNSISVDISALPAAVHGSTTAPSVEEMQQAMLSGIAQIMSFKDNQGEPMNEYARDFLWVGPPSLFLTASAAVKGLTTAALQQNLNPNFVADLRVSVVMNARLAGTWTDKFAMFRTDTPTKGLVRQTEQEVVLVSIAEGSEYAAKNFAWWFGIDAWRGAALGAWQKACLVTLT